MAESTAIEARDSNGHTEYLQPRARKPGPMQFAKLGLNSDDVQAGKTNGALREALKETASDISSGRTTPIPADAPPSVQASSSARRQIRAEQRQRIFPTVEYVDRVSHFDPTSDYHDFKGFFVLFWIGLAVMVLTSMLRNMKETGYPLIIRQWGLFTERVWELGLSDGAMVFSTAVSLPLHRLFMSSRVFRWHGLGMAIQSLYQTGWLAFWTTWPFIRNWSWTAQVFFTLHLLAIGMKMHSYAFYLGHLSETRRRLNDLDTPDTASKSAAYRYPRPRSHLHEIPQSPTYERTEKDKFNDAALKQLREDLALELASPLGNVSYPENLTLANYADFILCPTLCYEIEYPRTPKIRWMELFYKTLAVAGCIFLMTVTAEEFVLPVLDEASVQLQDANSASEFLLILGETIGRMLFPFMVIFLLVFLSIFEYTLGAFAEITRFADRQFYADWWNSSDWLEFSREWNKPVHHFFRRHVYSASKTHVSRPVATVITFFISALAHELVLGCITRKFRGYGFFAMMLQMPFVMIQRSRLGRGKDLLNNVLFWCSMILGLSMMCALYVLV
ncbi:MBOAT, membrane-bound O-acyltransferase family-domain-containing protein [Lophiotrema nucula]|uniref:O-acyltransferase n=1 Tax=Lophiotrema nucula TaxID=690887 RepID=A0A6A5Z627_9PLEO|nr:MBOAT, membrane-bound O-acyltransferase family-domain-containing protein [Lophiotrema nucula]